MKAGAIAAAILLGRAGAALADPSGTTLYGNIDSGVLVTRLPGVGTTTAQFSGGRSPDYFGFKGVEDLGDGMSAGFKLESGIDISNGQDGQFPPSTALFNREANVFVDGEFGRFTLGNQKNAEFMALKEVDPRGVSAIGSALQYDTMGGSLTSVANALTYATPDLAGLKISAQYLFGGISGNSQAGSGLHASAIYTHEDFTASVGWFTDRSPSPMGKPISANTALIAGARYQLGAATVSGFWGRWDSTFNAFAFGAPGGSITPYRTGSLQALGLGGQYVFNPRYDMDLGLYHLNNPDGTNQIESNMLATGLSFRLSKRTSLYGQFIYINDDSGQSARNPLFINDGPTTSPPAFVPVSGIVTMYNVGIRHSF